MVFIWKRKINDNTDKDDDDQQFENEIKDVDN